MKNYKMQSKGLGDSIEKFTQFTGIKKIADSIVQLIPTLLEKKIDLFSSKVNSNLLTLI